MNRDANAESELLEAIQEAESWGTVTREDLKVLVKAARSHLERQAAGEGVDQNALAWVKAQAKAISKDVQDDWTVADCTRVIASEIQKWRDLYNKECFQEIPTGGVISFKNLYYAERARTQGAAVDVQNGWKLVPVEATEEMKAVAEDALDDHFNGNKGGDSVAESSASVYRAMVAAAPAAQGHIPAPAKESTVPPIDSFASRCEGAEIINTALGGAVDSAPSSEMEEVACSSCGGSGKVFTVIEHPEQKGGSE